MYVNIMSSTPNDIRETTLKKRLDNTACVIATCMCNAMDHIKGWKLCSFLRYKLTAGLLNTERSYKRQGHATVEALCWLFLQWWKAEINNGRITQKSWRNSDFFVTTMESFT